MEDRPVSGDTSLLKTSITAVAHSRAISSYTWINKYIYLPLQCMFIIVHCSREGIKKFIWWVHHLLSLACEQALHLGVQLMNGSDFPSTRTTNSVRLILGSQYSIGNPTLSHVQLCENYIKRTRLFWELKRALGSSMIPLRTKFDTQTTVNSHRRRKRSSSSAGLLLRSEFSDRRHNTGFGDNSIVFLHLPRKFRVGPLCLLSVNFDFRNVIFQPMVFPFVWAK